MNSRFSLTENRIANILVAAYLGFLLGHAVSMFWPGLSLAWFGTSDENVLLAEVIRFSDLDFHQHFFDMPGTPLMLLGAVEWRIYYLFSTILDSSSGSANLFTFQHLQQLFSLLRANSLLFFVLSAVLLFRIVSTATNKYAGAAAATLLLLNPSYAGTVPFVRVEPLAMCFMLAAVIVMTESKSRLKTFWAGCLGGLGAACRLHSLTATLPLLVLLLVSQSWSSPSESPRFLGRFFFRWAASILAGSLLSFYFFAFGHTPLRAAYPLAFALFEDASLWLAAFVFAIALTWLIPKVRLALVKIVTPDLARLFAGLVVGLVLGIPTVFTQFQALLRSVNFYESSGYSDAVAARLPLADKVASLFRFYIAAISPDKISLVLLTVGASLIIFVPYHRKLLPYLIVAIGFFFSEPLNLVRAVHHVAMWIPFFAMVASLPWVAVTGLLETKGRAIRYVTAATAVAALFWLRSELRNGPAELKANMAGHLERTRNIDLSRAWISSHTQKGTRVMVAFYCFGPEIFYAWFRQLDVTVPAAQEDGRRYELWWGNQSALKGIDGVACVSPSDTPFLKQWELRQPGEGMDPLHDSRFRLAASFGQGPNQIDLLKFDFRPETGGTAPSPR